MPSVKPFISIVIPTFNSARTIRQCLDSVLQQDYERFEVIAIEGGSTDRTIQILKDYSLVKLIHSKRNILGYMRQLGVERSEGDIIAFIDSDIILPNRSWLKTMMDHLSKSIDSDGRVAAIFTLWRYSREMRWTSRYTTLYFKFILMRNRILRKGSVLLKTFFWGTGQTLIDKRAIEAVGGFNHRIHYFEDSELAERMAAHGSIFILSTRPLDAVTHLYADSFSAYLRKFYTMSRLGALQFGGKLNLIKEIASIPWSVLCMVRGIARDRDPVWIVHPVLQVARTSLRSLALARYTQLVENMKGEDKHNLLLKYGG